MKFPKIGGQTLRRAMVAVVVVCAVVAIAALIIGYREFKHELTVLRGVALTDTRADVEYRLGVPKEVLGPEVLAGSTGDIWSGARRVYTVNGPRGDQNSMPQDRSTSDYDAWVYSDADATDDSFYFDAAGRVKGESCATFNTNMFACGPVAGIWSLDPEEKVLRLGKPSSVELDHGTKIIRYDDIGLEFWLAKTKVYSIRLAGPKGGEGAILVRYLHAKLHNFLP